MRRAGLRQRLPHRGAGASEKPAHQHAEQEVRGGRLHEMHLGHRLRHERVEQQKLAAAHGKGQVAQFVGECLIDQRRVIRVLCQFVDREP